MTLAVSLSFVYMNCATTSLLLYTTHTHIYLRTIKYVCTLLSARCEPHLYRLYILTIDLLCQPLRLITNRRVARTLLQIYTPLCGLKMWLSFLCKQFQLFKCVRINLGVYCDRPFHKSFKFFILEFIFLNNTIRTFVYRVPIEM